MPLKPEDASRVEIPLSEVLPAPAGGVDTGKRPPEPPHGIGHHIKFPWNKEIKAVAIIPDFVVPTHDARAVLPPHYQRTDVVGIPAYNITCCQMLTLSLRFSTCSG
jgi:homoserine kinase